MNEKHTKVFKAAYDYWFENVPLNEAMTIAAAEEKPVEALTEAKKDKEEKAEEKEDKKEGKKESKKDDKKEDKAEKKGDKKDKKKEDKKDLKENAFEAHVLCNACGSGDLELSPKKTKIRCKECGNTGLTENVVG